MLMTVAAPARSQEPRWDLSAELAVSRLSAVEATAAAVGGRLSYRLADWLAADGGVLFAPGDLGEPTTFSASQTEVLLGLRAGPAPGPLGAYAAVRAGTVSFAEAPGPLACIAIFPPPLECVLAEGTTRLAVQVAAGAELLAWRSGLVRLEVGDRLVRLPGPSFDRNRRAREGDYWSHELRVAVSAGFRF